MTKTWFVTGTDTGVGKSLVAAGLLVAAAARGLRTVGLKPVAAGCDEQGHNEDALLLQSSMTEQQGHNEDALLLQSSMTEPLDYAQVNPVALRAPIAPHLAALEEGRSLRASQLAGYCRRVMIGGAGFILIEGAGGWRVPLNSRETLARLPCELQLPVILVVAMRLCCINHALLTAESIQRDGLTLAGWVANRIDPDMQRYRENVDSLREWLPAPLLGEIPFLSEPDPQAVSKNLDISILVE